MLQLKSMQVREWPETENTHFPFTLPVIRALPEIDFTTPVTFFVGENGSGKSTLMEALACAAGSITVNTDVLDLTIGLRGGGHRPPWMRWMNEGEFKALVAKRVLHGLVLVMSTETFRAVGINDLWLRFVIGFFATLTGPDGRVFEIKIGGFWQM